VQDVGGGLSGLAPQFYTLRATQIDAFTFLARDSMQSALYAIANPPVCPSVKRVDQ